MSNFKKLLAIITIALLALIINFVFHKPDLAYILVVIFCGIISLSMLIDMIKTLKSGQYGVDILTISAIIVTLLVGDYWDSLMILIMLTGGESLEYYSSKQASRQLRSLLDNSPKIAYRLVGHELEDVPVEALKIDDVVVVRPDEMVPVDGRILSGESDFNEASLTGEAKPIEKKVGDNILSGSMNGSNSIQFEVTSLAEDNQYQQLVRLVKESTSNPAPFVRLADLYSIPFTVIAYLIGGFAWFISKDPVRFAQVLVVASTCPLILAAPVALVAGMSQASKNGIIIRTGTTLEKLSGAKSVAFDKTGTITQGNLAVSQIIAVEGTTEKELIQLAASLEQNSSHILARSLVQYAKIKGITFLPVTSATEVTAQGIIGKISGNEVSAGKPILIKNFSSKNLSKETSIYVGKNDHLLGYIIFKDSVRPEAKEIAEQVGINKVFADCLPQDKIKHLKDIEIQDGPVLMVGDGVNDAPVLVTADVGISRGAHGSTAASENADVVIMKDDLSKVVQVIAIAKHTMKIAKQSVLIGLFVYLALMVIAATGVIPTLLGAMLQEVVDTVSILSALRARKNV
ncbi:heavy metal translocating P-type ATPase [Streptococcus lutetiensis]|uniref:heavy metal translocating P-type ATPase n=1 Tax=Streptococcus lutetiensis TaxID=150055 RepID=UPI0022E0927A|nr:heavy metal translocating P-type ATPase [Streptococcus lutetiensis]